MDMLGQPKTSSPHWQQRHRQWQLGNSKLPVHSSRSKHIVHAVDDGRNVVAAPVAVPLEPLEAELLSKMTPRTRAKFLEASICKLYYFSQPQLHVFHELVNSMKNCRVALTALALSNIMLSIVQALGYGEAHEPSSAFLFDSGLTIGDVAYWADSLMVAVLINYATGPFERVMSSRTNQMARAFQGVNRLALIFQQLSIGSVAVSTVTALEAAAKYPPLVLGTSALFFLVAVVRSGAMWWTLSRHTTNNEEISRTLDAMRDPEHSSYARQMSILDRWAVFLSFGYLLQYENTAAQANASQSFAASATTTTDSITPSSPTTDNSNWSSTFTTDDDTPFIPPSIESQPCYEFNTAEERVLRGLTDAASTAGLLLGLQAFATLILAVADFGVEDYPSLISNGINVVNKAAMATILYNACASYDRALHSQGSNDAEHLIEGMGSKGLTGLFDSLAVLSWGITLATLAGLAVPFMEENVIARAVGDGLSHRTAEWVVEGLQYARSLLRAV